MSRVYKSCAATELFMMTTVFSLIAVIFVPVFMSLAGFYLWFSIPFSFTTVYLANFFLMCLYYEHFNSKLLLFPMIFLKKSFYNGYSQNEWTEWMNNERSFPLKRRKTWFKYVVVDDYGMYEEPTKVNWREVFEGREI